MRVLCLLQFESEDIGGLVAVNLFVYHLHRDVLELTDALLGVLCALSVGTRRTDPERTRSQN